MPFHCLGTYTGTFFTGLFQRKSLDPGECRLGKEIGNAHLPQTSCSMLVQWRKAESGGNKTLLFKESLSMCTHAILTGKDHTAILVLFANSLKPGGNVMPCIPHGLPMPQTPPALPLSDLESQLLI